VKVVVVESWDASWRNED